MQCGFNSLNMKKISAHSAAIAAIVIVPCVVLFALSIKIFFTAQQIVISSKSASYSVSDLRTLSFAVMILCLVFVASGAGILQLKEWARKLAIVMSMVTSSTLLCFRMVDGHKEIDWLLYLANIAIFFYLTNADIKKLFQ